MRENQIEKIQKLVTYFEEVEQSVRQWDEYKKFNKKASKFLDDNDKKRAYQNTSDPRFNSFSWAKDVEWLIDQIFLSFYWMEAHARHFEEEFFDPSIRPYDTNWATSYYADNCMVGINSCKDKIALMVWAFYCPFDIRQKEEILDFGSVIKRLRHPAKFAIKLENSKEFCDPLNGLNDEVFNDISKYRHKKIHRREPKIIMGDVEDFHYRDYIFPMLDQNELENWKKDLEANGNCPEVIEGILKRSEFEGIMYRSKSVEGLLFSYSDVKDQIERAFKKTLKVAATCFDILDSRLFPK